MLFNFSPYKHYNMYTTTNGFVEEIENTKRYGADITSAENGQTTVTIWFVGKSSVALSSLLSKYTRL